MIAVAYKSIPAPTTEWNNSESLYTIEEENDLIFAGFLAFLDLPKETVGMQ